MRDICTCSTGTRSATGRAQIAEKARQFTTVPEHAGTASHARRQAAREQVLATSYVLEVETLCGRGRRWCVPAPAARTGSFTTVLPSWSTPPCHQRRHGGTTAPLNSRAEGTDVRHRRLGRVRSRVGRLRDDRNHIAHRWSHPSSSRSASKKLVRLNRCVRCMGLDGSLNPLAARSQLTGRDHLGLRPCHARTAGPRKRRGGACPRPSLVMSCRSTRTSAISTCPSSKTTTAARAYWAPRASEIRANGVASAIANAVFHATGRRVRDFPIQIHPAPTIRRIGGRPAAGTDPDALLTSREPDQCPEPIGASLGPTRRSRVSSNEDAYSP